MYPGVGGALLLPLFLLIVLEPASSVIPTLARIEVRAPLNLALMASHRFKRTQAHLCACLRY